MNLAMGLIGGGLEGITSTVGGIFQGLGQGLSSIGNPQQQSMQRMPQSSGSNTMIYVVGGVSLVVVLGVVVVVVMKNKQR